MASPATMRALAIALATCLILGGCSSGGYYLPPGPSTAVGATSDVNPQNPATLRDGGDLRLALTEFPPNFNTLDIDGNSADVGGMVKATLPRAFVIGPDGSTTVDT
ncbi:MAG: glutathione transport system substrate-binding protein, partial [Mycobacterium sp.]|nr:glutathione transport system substrate-binding protein [Mycobacterium sp.]